MAISEVGHAKNVAQLGKLITYLQGFGATYAPTNPAISITALQTLHTTLQDNINDVHDKSTTYKVAVNARQDAFRGYKKLATRIISALKASGASADIIDDARTINKRIQGTSIKNDPTATPPPTPTSTTSTSQQSYDKVIDHFTALITLLNAEPQYTPAEPDLKPAALATYHTNLQTTTTAIHPAAVAVANARIIRDKALYQPSTGLIDIVQTVKAYVKSIYGATSPEYKLISSIKFTSIS